MKLNQIQLGAFLSKIYLLTESGYSLLDSIDLIRKNTHSPEFLPISRIGFDLQEGYSYDLAIEMNSEPLDEVIRHALHNLNTDSQFCRLLPAIITSLKAA
ncbi:hypothetical protein ACFFSY_32850 [Paenibacillus aurantiacus]|uniref:Uncharacterized protein n=1 Tax=Paenibacillus aurantiacus TaxID=1936118 RepID=A0ABV5KZZ2_9BACL